MLELGCGWAPRRSGWPRTTALTIRVSNSGPSRSSSWPEGEQQPATKSGWQKDMNEFDRPGQDGRRGLRSRRLRGAAVAAQLARVARPGPQTGWRTTARCSSTVHPPHAELPLRRARGQEADERASSAAEMRADDLLERRRRRATCPSPSRTTSWCPSATTPGRRSCGARTAQGRAAPPPAACWKTPTETRLPRGSSAGVSSSSPAKNSSDTGADPRRGVSHYRQGRHRGARGGS